MSLFGGVGSIIVRLVIFIPPNPFGNASFATVGLIDNAVFVFATI
jgi:hypothetical protein